MTGLESQLCYGVLNQATSLKKFIYSMTVKLKMCYFLQIRVTKDGQECGDIKHLEIFSMSPVER